MQANRTWNSRRAHDRNRRTDPGLARGRAQSRFRTRPRQTQSPRRRRTPRSVSRKRRHSSRGRPGRLRAKNYDGASKTSLEGWEELGLEVVGLSRAIEALREADGNYRNGEAKVRDALEIAAARWLTRGEAENGIGVLEALVGNSDLARTHFQAALSADLRHYRAITNLGNLELEAGNLERAEELYKQVVQLNPDYSVVYNNLAAVMRKRGKRHDAVEYLKKSQRLYMRELRGQTKGTSVGKVQNPVTNWFANPAARWGLFIIAAFLIWRFVLNR
ncbi:MAG: tetratricopeptide repeat protein [Pleurocapsa sp. SU_196_0]|nr:tetratricopeptide repeat protein [Pleurocapsa sp. SU_196_0]